MAKGGSSATISKIVALLGTGAFVFVLATWLLPKIEKPHPMVHGGALPPALHPAAALPVHHSVATSPAAVHQGTGPIRDYNLAGLGIASDVPGYPGPHGTIAIGGIA
jgi:hypothetical protein